MKALLAVLLVILAALIVYSTWMRLRVHGARRHWMRHRRWRR